MFRFAVRYGLVRLVGRRAVPLMVVWDLAVLADRTRRIPFVDRGLRRGAGVARRGLGSVAGSPRWTSRPSRPNWPSRPGGGRRPDPDA
jgi:hypothetical protein